MTSVGQVGARRGRSAVRAAGRSAAWSAVAMAWDLDRARGPGPGEHGEYTAAAGSTATRPIRRRWATASRPLGTPAGDRGSGSGGEPPYLLDDLADVDLVAARVPADLAPRVDQDETVGVDDLPSGGREGRADLEA